MLLTLRLQLVSHVTFADIQGVDLIDDELMNRFMMRMAHASEIRFFGYFTEDRLHIDEAQLTSYVERIDPAFNQEMTDDIYESQLRSTKHRKRLRQQRSMHRKLAMTERRTRSIALPAAEILLS
ncbi:hypothetical protein AB6A40_011483 [Gnathostoma spinigerum]|uniref:Uncharacterized protein n=1 Tax=Gnathostoma spinigerum TaxID=75299 RepID=A0ABD6F1U7_9BILA